MFDWKEVKSSNLARMRQNADGTLDVEFHNGQTYRYSGVPNSAIEETLKAQSAGSEFHRLIAKDYKFTKL